MNRRVVLFLLAAVATVMSCASQTIRTGAEQTEKYLPMLEGKRVAVLANHTSMVGEENLVDLLCRKGVNVAGIFSPEHGFRGNADAGQHVGDSVDEATGVAVWSLYDGKRLRPSDEIMHSFDILIIDLQDVGLRFYTYYISMLRMTDACADFGREVIILDRPNPNGMYVDGPILDMKYKSGVGALPIPAVHGMTLGEIALMAMGEGWNKQAHLTVIPVENYRHSMRYELPVAPSPNLKTQHAVYLYPSVCLFEGTVVSLGRGTDHPFEMYGHPKMKGCDFSFTPQSVAGAQNPPFKGQKCFGVDLRGKNDEQIIAEGFSLEYIIDAYRRLDMGEAFFTSFFEKLTGVDYIRRMIIEGCSADEIRAMWHDDIEAFRKQRKPYLLYSE